MTRSVVLSRRAARSANHGPNWASALTAGGLRFHSGIGGMTGSGRISANGPASAGRVLRPTEYVYGCGSARPAHAGPFARKGGEARPAHAGPFAGEPARGSGATRLRPVRFAS